MELKKTVKENKKRLENKKLVKEKRKKLIREKQIKQIKEETEKPMGTWSTTSSFCDLSPFQEDEIVTINISGEVFQTYDATLSRYPNTLLGNRIQRLRLLNPETGEIYLDRNVKAFECIFYYYQSGGEMALPLVIPFNNFIEELLYFRIDPAVIKSLKVEHGIVNEEEDMDLPESCYLRPVWKFIEYPNSSIGAAVFSVFSASIILASIVLFVMESLPIFSLFETVEGSVGTLKRSFHGSWMIPLNDGIMCWFTAEVFIRFIACPDKSKFIFKFVNLIDMLSILPWYVKMIACDERTGCGNLEYINTLRVLRILRLVRYSRGLQILGLTLKASYRELVMLGFLLFIMILIFASVVFYCEHNIEGTEYMSIPHAAWWGIVTLTTTGYGDMYPQTLAGKLFGCLALLCGLIVMSLPIPSVVSQFSFFYEKERNRQAADTRKSTCVRVKELCTDFVRKTTRRFKYSSL